MTNYILSLLVFTPLAGSLIVMLLPSEDRDMIRRVALGIMILELVFTAVLLVQFVIPGVAVGYAESFQLVEREKWIDLSLGGGQSFVIYYHLGVDGISLPLVVLSSIVLLIGLISSWKTEKQTKGYFVLYLILAASIQGCFLALDFFLFYLFFELMLLPMFFLIGIWGGERRSYASIKFFIYTLVGSLLILGVMIGLYLSVYDPAASQMGALVRTFDLILMSNFENYIPNSVFDPAAGAIYWGVPARFLAFLLLFIGFAIKLPAVPVHTWLPDAHVEAPTSISVILAALLLKVGGYGLIRIAYMIFPDAAIHYSYLVGFVGVLSILYGGLNAIAQRDFKRLVAYSSVSHMGFILVGLASLTSEGASGALFQMISHGLISAGLFLVVGVLYDRTHNRRIENFSGLASKLPGYTFVVVIMFFASLGLPGLSGFVGEVLVLMGAFGGTALEYSDITIWMAVLSVTGIILSAVYYLWTLQRMFFGQYFVREATWEPKMKDLSAREWGMFVPLIVLILLLGVYPRAILDYMDASVNIFVTHIIDQGSALIK
jgi:NADH-quinone oxidoreductase subunit M